jgi:3-dehydroquinate synthase
VGGKVAINTPWAKNFVGAFHHPAAVFCDPEVLATLARRDISSGVAEALKVALTGDRALFELLEDRAVAIMEQRDATALAAVVRRAIRRKIDLLDPDPYEVDLRRVLNLGHTVAHPLETEFEYEGLRHGEAVGFGLGVAVEVARHRGVCSAQDAERIHTVLARYDLPPALPPSRCRAALNHLEAIRMVRGGHLHFVMPTRIDAVQIVPDVDFSELARAMDAVLARQAVDAA